MDFRLYTLVVVGIIASWALACGGMEVAPRVRDGAQLLTAAQREELAKQGNLIHRETGVDLAWSLQRRFEEGVDAHSPAYLDQQGIGSDGRALLFSYDQDAAKLRIEVGYGLEGLLPDARVGRFLDGHLLPLFEEEKPDLAFLLTARMVRDRIRLRALESGGQEPAAANLAHASGGAGASRRIPHFPSEKEGAPRDSEATRFAPAPTVFEAYERYIAWLSDGAFDTQIRLFTSASRTFLSRWPMTPGYLEHILWKERGRHFVVVERADFALLVCTNDPHVAPHFFERSAQGWQMDIVAETNEIVNLVGGTWSWTFRDPSAPALAPFADALFERGGFTRLRDGDNRSAPVPTREAQASKARETPS